MFFLKKLFGNDVARSAGHDMNHGRDTIKKFAAETLCLVQDFSCAHFNHDENSYICFDTATEDFSCFASTPESFSHSCQQFSFACCAFVASLLLNPLKRFTGKGFTIAVSESNLQKKTSYQLYVSFIIAKNHAAPLSFDAS